MGTPSSAAAEGIVPMVIVTFTEGGWGVATNVIFGAGFILFYFIIL